MALSEYLNVWEGVSADIMHQSATDRAPNGRQKKTGYSEGLRVPVRKKRLT